MFEVVCTATMAFGEDRVVERGLLTVSDEVWQTAVQRAGVIGPPAVSSSVGLGAVDARPRRWVFHGGRYTYCWTLACR